MVDHDVDITQVGDADLGDSDFLPPASAQQHDEENIDSPMFVSQEEDNEDATFVPQEENDKENSKDTLQESSRIVDKMSRDLPDPRVPIQQTKNWSAPKDPRMLSAAETIMFNNLTMIAAHITRLEKMVANHFDEFLKFKSELRRSLGSIAGSSNAGSRRNSTASIATRRSSMGQGEVQNDDEEDEDGIILSPGQKQKDLATSIITNYNDFLHDRFAAFMTNDGQGRPVYIIKNEGAKKYSKMFFTDLKDEAPDNANEDEAITLRKLQPLLRTASKDTYTELYVQLAKHWKTLQAAESPKTSKQAKGKKRKTVQTLSASQKTIRDSDNSSSQPGPSTEHPAASDSSPQQSRRAAKRTRYIESTEEE